MAESPRSEQDEDTEAPGASTDKGINDPLTRTDVKAPRAPFDPQQEPEK